MHTNNGVLCPFNPLYAPWFGNNNGKEYHGIYDTVYMADNFDSFSHNGQYLDKLSTTNRRIFKDDNRFYVLGDNSNIFIVLDYLEIEPSIVQIQTGAKFIVNQEIMNNDIQLSYDIILKELLIDNTICSAPVTDILNGAYWGFRYNNPSSANKIEKILNSDRYIFTKENYNENVRYYQ